MCYQYNKISFASYEAITAFADYIDIIIIKKGCKMNDLTGQKFGRLTVLSRAPNKNKRTMWHCKCDCEGGSEIDVEAYNLKSGHTKSCGCLHKNAGENKLNHLIGERFGRLVVIARDNDYISPKGKHHVKWVCLCDCGNCISADVNSLRNGETNSCGCYAAEQRFKTHKKYNKYEIIDDYVTIYTSKGEPFYVDLEDFDKVKNICWHRTNDGYIVNRSKDTTTMLHRYVTNCPPELQVDHIGGNKTRNDNRKSNLRYATYSQNSMNRCLNDKNLYGVTGVAWDIKREKWVATITADRHKHYLGAFDNFDDAVNARHNGEIKYFGEYSYNNSQKIKEENENARKKRSSI